MKNSLLNSIFNFNPTEEESLKMWEEFGFLEGLDGDIKKETAAKMTEMYPTLLVSLYHRSKDIFFLINYIKERYPEYIEVLVYPIIRRCIQSGDLSQFYSPHRLCRFIATTYEALRQGFWSLGTSEKLDSDGEICALISYLFTKKDDKENN